MSFLFEGFILEAKEDALAFLKQKYGSEMEPSVIDYFFQNDPTSDKKYTKWLIENYIFYKEAIRPDGQMTVPEYMIEKIVLYNNSRRNLPQQLNDFKKFSFIDLMAKIAKFYKSKRETELPQEAKEGAKLIWQNNNFELYNITNKAASCHYGKGTKWCISRQDEDHFNTYSDSGCVFFFLIFKQKIVAGENYKHAIVISKKGKPPLVQPNSIIEWRNPEQTKRYSMEEISSDDFKTILEELRKFGVELQIGKEKKKFVNRANQLIERNYENGILSNEEGPAEIVYYEDFHTETPLKKSESFYVNGEPSPQNETFDYKYDYYKNGFIREVRCTPPEDKKGILPFEIIYLKDELVEFQTYYNEKDWDEDPQNGFFKIYKKIKYNSEPERVEKEIEIIFYEYDSSDSISFLIKIIEVGGKSNIKYTANNVSQEKDYFFGSIYVKQALHLFGEENIFHFEKPRLLHQSETVFESKKQNLKESFLAMFGSIVELAIKRMFGFDIPNISFKGHPTDVQRLAKTLASEKRYIDSYLNNKLNSPEVIQNKFRLEKAIYDFERETGIPWPIR